MDITIENLQDTFRIGYDAFAESRIAAAEVQDFYHNRQYTAEQLLVLDGRGQPAETFNVIKLFSRMLNGYYGQVITAINVEAAQFRDIPTASLLNDLVDHVLVDNNFVVEGAEIKLDGILSGLMVAYVDVVDTGKADQFGRPIRAVKVHQVPSEEVVIDPGSKKIDYSDAAYIHRFKWLSKDQAVALFTETKIKKLTAYENHLQVAEAEFTYTHANQFNGIYRRHDNFLIVHSVMLDNQGVPWSVFWSGSEILEKVKLPYKEVKSSYRVQRLHSSNRSEYYGVFREVIESQRAINQALLKIQLMVNTHKVFVEEGAVDDLTQFQAAMSRVNSVIPVSRLAGIKVEQMTAEIANQYVIIDRAFDRIQRILGINDSFLGMAFAADSGRKVKLQQNATVMSLGYLTERIDNFYRLLGWDIINLIKQFYTATQVVRIVDDIVGARWLALNQPMTVMTGQIDPETGQPVTRFVWEEVLDPATGEPIVDDDGNIVIAPVPTAETEIAFSEVDVTVSSVNFSNQDESTQLMLETTLAGPVGQILMQVNPAGYMEAASLALRTVKTKYSPELAKIYSDTAAMLSQNPAAQQQAQEQAGGMGGSNGGATSKDLKLPQNTNEQAF